MDDKSPFGGLTHISIRGTQQTNDQVVHLMVLAEFGDGRSAISMKVSLENGGGLVTWNGVGEITYGVMLENTDRAEVTFTYVHDAEERSIMLSTVVQFGPNGIVHMPDRTLVLDREDVILFGFPRDIVKDKLLRRSERDAQRADLEALYGMSLAESSPKRPKPGGGFKKGAENHPKRQKPWFYRGEADGEGGKLMDLDTFSKMSKKLAEEDKDYIELVLLPKWGAIITKCVHDIFRDERRIRTLLRKWNEHPPFTKNVVASFIRAFLTSPIKFRITDTHLYFFADVALAIPKLWLTTDEHIFVDKLFVARKELFRVINFSGIASRYSISDFLLDHVMADAICRRFIVQQFALDLVECAFRRQDPTIIGALITAVGACYVENKKDVFLAHLVSATERRTILVDLQQLGMSVKINGTTPEYEFFIESSRRGRSHSVLPKIPTTPFRLVTPQRK